MFEMKEFIFVTDFLPTEITGGAELTFEAIRLAAPEGVSVKYVKSQDIRPNTWLMKDVHWVLGNYTRIPREAIEALCELAQQRRITYSIVEFDYKYCIMRNEKVHNYNSFLQKNYNFCRCASDVIGTYTKVLFSFAQKVHFMSQEQMNLIMKRLPEIVQNKDNMRVQWSTWTEDDLGFIEELFFLRNSKNSNNNKFAIQNSPNWLKGTEAGIEYAKEHNLEYELIEPMEYREFLKKLCDYRGFIFLPNAYDTCPRVVVEAKLLGLEYVINNNVQIKKELMEAIPGGFLDSIYRKPRNFWKSYQL